ncbi:MAG: ABC transporter permease subunit [Beijerinckiaceae bacterium]|nr:ABC transporter permease subunit [Beijerinckiaceae bacterium]
MSAGARPRNWTRWLTFAIPCLWLTLFFALPFAVIVRLSLSQSIVGQPPYAPQFDLGAGVASLVEGVRQFSLDNFAIVFSDALYLESYASSLRLAFISTALALVIAYPMALAMSRAPKHLKPALILLAIAPFWTSFLIRVYAWIAILRDEGLLNNALLGLGLIEAPLRIFATETAVIIGIVYSYLPFMVLPIFNAIDRQDRSLVEAAMDLGASRTSAFWTVTFPLSLPGLLAGSLLVFIPAVGEFVIPDLLGGSDTLMIGRTMWNEFFANRDWPVASAVAIVLLAALLVPLVLFERAQMRQQDRPEARP